jgi:transcriptional regulator with XRE-family HTH domain
MSQEELAFRAGTNKAYISRVERNLKEFQFIPPFSVSSMKVSKPTLK